MCLLLKEGFIKNKTSAICLIKQKNNNNRRRKRFALKIILNDLELLFERIPSPTFRLYLFILFLCKIRFSRCGHDAERQLYFSHIN